MKVSMIRCDNCGELVEECDLKNWMSLVRTVGLREANKMQYIIDEKELHFCSESCIEEYIERYKLKKKNESIKDLNKSLARPNPLYQESVYKKNYKGSKND